MEEGYDDTAVVGPQEDIEQKSTADDVGNVGVGGSFRQIRQQNRSRALQVVLAIAARLWGDVVRSWWAFYSSLIVVVAIFQLGLVVCPCSLVDVVTIAAVVVDAVPGGDTSGASGFGLGDMPRPIRRRGESGSVVSWGMVVPLDVGIISTEEL